MPSKSCVVIGAGLAGLSAAYRLRQRGWDVCVLEAQKRLGGRVRSYCFKQAPALVCELGAEWIGNDHKAMRRLCDDLGLGTEQHRYSTSFWMVNRRSRKVIAPDERTISERSDDRYEKFLREVKQYSLGKRQALDRLDWWTKLKKIGLTKQELRQRELEDGTDFGESIRMSSAYVAAAEYASSNYTDELDYKIAGGNSRLVRALAQRIESWRIRTHAIVTGIRQNGRRVHVAARIGGRPARQVRRGGFDACICTVPATQLGIIRWDPEPTEHLEAARELQYSRITKTAVLFSEKFWPKRKDSGFAVFTTGVADFCFDSTYSDYCSPKSPGILCSYSFGEKAANVAGADKALLAKWIHQDVLEAIGKKPKKKVVAKVKQMPWHEDPWTGGAYAFYRPGQWFAIRPVLMRPHGRVFFAGEHIADDNGFMEGAVKTGEAAADAL